MGTIHPLPENLQAFFADAANDGAIVMINQTSLSANDFFT
jgi:hypothetical protein